MKIKLPKIPKFRLSDFDKKYRIKHEKFSDGSQQWSIQIRKFGLYFLYVESNGFYDTYYRYDNFEDASNKLHELYERREKLVIQTHYIYKLKD